MCEIWNGEERSRKYTLYEVSNVSFFVTVPLSVLLNEEIGPVSLCSSCWEGDLRILRNEECSQQES